MLQELSCSVLWWLTELTYELGFKCKISIHESEMHESVLEAATYGWLRI